LVQLQLGNRFSARSRRLRQSSSQCFWQEKRALSEIALACGHDCLQCLLRRRPEKHFISTTRHKLKSKCRDIHSAKRLEHPVIKSKRAECRPHFLPVLLFFFLFAFFCSSLRPLWSPWSSSAAAGCSASLYARYYCICIICSRAALASSVSPLTLAAPLTAVCCCGCCGGYYGYYYGYCCCCTASWAAVAF
jgi:hypothetical protein